MERANRDLRPPIRVPRIRRCGGAARSAAVELTSRIAPWIRCVRGCVGPCVGPSIIARRRFADRAVKAASRAEARAERLDGADANRKMERDGPSLS
jgi:hypothetical protein